MNKTLPNFFLKQAKLVLILLAGIAVVSGLGYIFVRNSNIEARLESNSAAGDPEDAFPENAVSAIAFLEPEGGITNLSGTVLPEGSRLAELLVEQGEEVQAGQVIAILDSKARLEAALRQAEAQVTVARSQLDRVQAGAKQGEINALNAKLNTLEAELQGQATAQNALINRLQSDLIGQTNAQQAVIDRLAAELTTNKAECDRLSTLLDQGAVSTSEQENTCLAQAVTTKQKVEAEASLARIRSSGQEQIAEAEAQLNRTIQTLQSQQAETLGTLDQVTEVRGVDVSVAEAELTVAIAQLTQARAELDLAYVKAPLTGQILKINTRPGEIVTNQGIVEVGDTQNMYAIAEIYETDIHRIQVGQKATIISQAIDDPLRGTVDKIGLQVGSQQIFSTNPSLDVDTRVVEVDIRLDPSASRQVAHMTNMRVNVVIETN